MKNRQWVLGKWKAIFFWEKSPVMEKQIFNATIIIITLYLVAMIIFNFFINQFLLASILLGCIPALGLLYYMLRFKNKFYLSLIIFGSFLYPILAINFYLNDGIFGPSAYVFNIDEPSHGQYFSTQMDIGMDSTKCDMLPQSLLHREFLSRDYTYPISQQGRYIFRP